MRNVNKIVFGLLVAGLILALTPALMGSLGRVEAQSCGPTTTHLVTPGQTMFRIALRYGTTVSAIAAANGIANPNVIYVGSTLRIPCAGGATGPSATPVATAIPLFPINFPTTASVTGGNPVFQQPAALTCTNFRATSPTDGLAPSINTFYWNPAPGATGYRISIFNLDGGGFLAVTWDVGRTFTSITTDVSEGIVGPGFRFSWYVEALVNGAPVCRTQTVTVFRAVGTAVPPTAIPTVSP
jgi:LysM repeat protein